MSDFVLETKSFSGFGELYVCCGRDPTEYHMFAQNKGKY